MVRHFLSHILGLLIRQILLSHLSKELFLFLHWAVLAPESLPYFFSAFACIILSLDENGI